MFKNLNPEILGFSGRESEIIELTLSNGFKGFDLNLAELAEQVKSQGMARATRLLTSARLKFGSFELPVRWQEDAPRFEQDLSALPALAELAGQLGCTRAVTTIEPGSDMRPYHENFEVHRRRLTQIGEALAAHQIRLGVGFLAPVICRRDFAFQFMQKADEAAMLLRTINSPHVGLAFDAFHWHLGGGSLELLKALGFDKIVTVTLSDCDADATAAEGTLAARRLPGEVGTIDSAALLVTLAEVQYDGPITPAADKSHLAGQGRDKIVKAAAAALDTVWKAAGLTPLGKLAAVSGR